MTITTDQVRDYIGKNLYDSEGNKIGKIGMVFLDDQSGQPEWLTVSTGFFGMNESFVPLAQASAHEDGVQVPYSKDIVKDAPNIDADSGHLSPEQEDQLYSYYGMGSRTGQIATDTSADDTVTRTDFSDASPDPTAYAETSRAGDSDATSQTQNAPVASRDFRSDEDDAMTRSEEQVNVGRERVETGRARLRKWIETETESVEVPVRRERARLESEPITEGNRDEALSGQEMGEAEHEVTLTEERPVVTTEAVPVERVRLTKDTEEETRTVDADVRKERIDLDADDDVDQRR